MVMVEQSEQACERRGSRDHRIGKVVSRCGNKTIKVCYFYTIRHPKYGKYLRRVTSLHVHDERNEAKQGDWVDVVACRRFSKTKYWRLVRVVRSE